MTVPVFYQPDVGSPWLIPMFTDWSTWPRTQALVDIFGVHAEWANTGDGLAPVNGPWPYRGPNTLDALTAIDFFAKVSARWELALSLPGIGGQTGANECAAFNLACIQNVNSRGGVVKRIVFDEPYMAATRPPYNKSVAWAAAETLKAITIIKDAHPDMAVEEIEPINIEAGFAVSRLCDYLDACVALGIPSLLSRFYVDSDPLGGDVSAYAPIIVAKLQSLGVPWSWLLTGSQETVRTDAAYCAETKALAQSVQASVGTPSCLAFYNWKSADGVPSAPTAIPETSNNTETGAVLNICSTVFGLSIEATGEVSGDTFPVVPGLTRLSGDASATFGAGCVLAVTASGTVNGQSVTNYPVGTFRFGEADPPPVITPGNHAQFVSQSVPTHLSPGQTATVSITMLNVGTTTWTRSAQHNLGSQSPQDNLTFGIGRTVLAQSDAIASGQRGTFTFTITAPTRPGTYAFQWRMVQEAVEWFGDLTPTVAIVVA